MHCWRLPLSVVISVDVKSNHQRRCQEQRGIWQGCCPHLTPTSMPSPSSSEASFILVGGEASAHKKSSSGSSPSYAHDWSRRATGGNLHIHGRHFVDKYGRVCGLRGVNLSGSSKSPANHDDDVFPAEHETVTFVGRPFPLEEAHEHLSRLRRWGFTFIRFLVMWEAVEHAGLGIYDTEYLDYIRNLLSMLPQYGMIAFVALHQDVWSRYSGGSGAPAWTLEAVGFDLHKLEETGSAWLKGVKGGGHVEEEQGLWSCGYTKLAAATMATCFWAGDAFAPKLKLKNRHGDDVSVQEFLQGAFLDMFDNIVRAVGDLEAVIGFEMMNEPHRGYVELQSLHVFDYNTDLHLAHMPTAFESFQLGSGHPTEVAVYTRSFPMPTRKTSSAILNTEGEKVWRPDGPSQGQCIWEMHGVWGWDVNKKEGVILRENYFVKHPMTGQKIDWYDDFFYPFIRKWEQRKVLFIEGHSERGFFVPSLSPPEKQLSNMVYAPHWYDLNALFSKAFGDFTVNVQGLSRGMFPLKAFYWGHAGARDNYSLQIKNYLKKKAFTSDNWLWQTRIMDAMITGLERSLVGYTLWCYNPSHDDETGDNWNGESFSWFSRKRALPPFLLYYEQTCSVVRPYPAKTAGIPLRFEYEMNTGSFTFEWANADSKEETGQANPSVASPPISGHPIASAWETEIFIPSMITDGRKVVVDGLEPGDSYVHDEQRQTLFIVTENRTAGKRHKGGGVR
ncbi:glycoside hydrolase [Desarmillaria tabescens]|uniref:Glycoside hydrolase n=1 Tax=Armillaria tabescens TaxID=1929756 RepID=A0AA39N5V2_ARMTA|nr:glycoside hydrolase [Desarmillaria tabescens]KAK0458583.1 glycoside hydrolase [Desarmillaria tabescens]